MTFEELIALYLGLWSPISDNHTLSELRHYSCDEPATALEESVMTDRNYPYSSYNYDAWSLVERARKQLQLF